MEEPKQLIVEAIQLNMRKIDTFQTVLFIVGGTACGILGLTSGSGLFFFLLFSTVIAAAIATSTRFQVPTYTNSSFISLWIQGISNHALSFILFWTLAYALVYIY